MATYHDRLLHRGDTIIYDNPDLPVPRVHGNGFVQLDTKPGGSERLHIWGHPAIPQQSVRTGIHDHVYMVKSRILTGSLVDVSWLVDDCDPDESTHQAYCAVPRDGQDTELAPTGRYVQAVVQEANYYGEFGTVEGYTVLSGDFHSTVTNGPAATLMVKGDPNPRIERPSVLVPTGSTPDNSFNRNAFSVPLLWGIIDEVYPKWLGLL